jgi:AraC family transcriptional regulator, regulatory protein of adaptative response / DNA-3-methyladenine glycosylase II
MDEPFSAVRTTGIYCRPGCSARPDPGNVQRYASAAAAERDGFRACHRCRPYRYDAAPAPTRTQLICRAVHLVASGFLDHGDESRLATRLGVSARHLRRRFVDELGVTPDGLARSRRAHFARRLLDNTDLPVTEVAFAAGFGSVRQFNRTCQEVFRATPGELRDRRRRADRLSPPEDGLALHLPVHGPLDWDASLRFLTARAIPGVEHVDGSSYRRTVVADGQAGIIELQRGDDQQLLLQVHLHRWDGLIHLAERARRLVGADAAIDAPRRKLAADPIAAPLFAAMPGVRPPGAWDGFELGVRAILGQQVSVDRATSLAGRLVALLGTPLPEPEPGGLTHTFPTAEEVAGADMADLGVPAARLRAIQAFANAVATDAVRLDRSLELDCLVTQLCSLPGVGPWTAHYIALRLGEPDAFPGSDLGLRRALSPGAPLSAAALERLADAWRPWRASVAVRLWMASWDERCADLPGGPPRR